jgi:4-amino-4-deoxy-L-arabinose transferase-like glycosyltransferase
MHDTLVPRRDAVVWAGCFLVVATLLIAFRFSSSDGDSDLYAGLSSRLAAEPLSRWVAPEWWGFWPEAEMTGLFREHPGGALIIPAALVRLGVPGPQAAYVVGIGAGLATLLLIGWLLSRLVPRDDARAALVLLQLMPVAFLFRIRANHEYLMLVGLLVALVGLERVRQSCWAVVLVAGGLAGALLVKGVFVVLTIAGAVLWVFIDPADGTRPRTRPLIAIIVGVLVTVAAGIGYEFWFRAVTGEAYWVPYWQRQLGQVEVATPMGGGVASLTWNVFFYLNRLAWHAAPWSLALMALMWTTRGAWGSRWRALRDQERRGLLFALTYGLLLVVLLSPSSRVAERYIFSGTYAVAAAGTIVALRIWPRVAAWCRVLDERVPAAPALVWLALMIARLAIGPWMPRIG